MLQVLIIVLSLRESSSEQGKKLQAREIKLNRENQAVAKERSLQIFGTSSASEVILIKLDLQLDCELKIKMACKKNLIEHTSGKCLDIVNVVSGISGIVVVKTSMSKAQQTEKVIEEEGANE